MDYKEETCKTYDLNADRFEEATKDFLRQYKLEETDRFISLLSGRRILDLGSGPGRDSAYFASRGLEPVCLDLSFSMIKKCSQKNLRACVADMENLPFSPGTFDGGWASMAFLHVPKYKMPHVLSSVDRALKPLSPLFLSVKEGEGERMVSSDKYDGQRFFSFFHMQELEDLVKPFFNIVQSYRKSIGDMTYLSYLCQKLT
jgi:SAM-dependent methyltransferase